MAGNYACVADGAKGLRIVDVSRPTDPAEVAFYVMAREARRVAVAGGYIYVAAADGGLFVLRFLPYSVCLPLVLRNSP